MSDTDGKSPATPSLEEHQRLGRQIRRLRWRVERRARRLDRLSMDQAKIGLYAQCCVAGCGAAEFFPNKDGEGRYPLACFSPKHGMYFFVGNPDGPFFPHPTNTWAVCGCVAHGIRCYWCKDFNNGGYYFLCPKHSHLSKWRRYRFCPHKLNGDSTVCVWDQWDLHYDELDRSTGTQVPRTYGAKKAKKTKNKEEPWWMAWVVAISTVGVCILTALLLHWLGLAK